MKRILTENLSESGSLDTDAVLKAILAYKNTPDESGLSPAMVLMGRQLKDAMPVIPRKEMCLMTPMWPRLGETCGCWRTDCAKGIEKLNLKVQALTP